MCYQTSFHNRVIIKMLYRYFQRCLLGWHGSRLGFVTPYDGEISLGPLGNTTSQEACKHVTNEFSHGILYYGTSKEICW